MSSSNNSKHLSIIKDFKGVEAKIERLIKSLERKHKSSRRLLSIKEGKVELGAFIDADLV